MEEQLHNAKGKGSARPADVDQILELNFVPQWAKRSPDEIIRDLAEVAIVIVPVGLIVLAAVVIVRMVINAAPGHRLVNGVPVVLMAIAAAQGRIQLSPVNINLRRAVVACSITRIFRPGRSMCVFCRNRRFYLALSRRSQLQNGRFHCWSLLVF